MKKNKAIFAGSFDPVHQGHIQVVKKAINIFDKVIVLVANNDFKEKQSHPLKRIDEIKQKINFKNVTIDFLKNDQYLGTYAKQHNVKYLIRSARNNIDFNYELDMSKLNKKINNDLETILIIPNYDDIKYTSSKFKNYQIDKNK